MGRKRVYFTTRIETIERKIALWELLGYDEQAEGLRQFFGSVLDEANIEQQKANFAKYDDDLAANYSPKVIEETPKKTHRYKPGSSWGEVKTVRGRKGDKIYRYKYLVTVDENGKRKSKPIGKVGE